MELEKFKKILENRLKKVEDDIKMLLSELEELAIYDSIDDIEDLAELETINDSNKALLQKLLEERKAIKKALAKIKNGTYGRCADGSPIPAEKLEADPLYEC